MPDQAYAAHSGTPFSLRENLCTMDEQVTQLIVRTSNINDRLTGPRPEGDRGPQPSPSNMEELVRMLGTKLDVLSSNIGRIDIAL